MRTCNWTIDDEEHRGRDLSQTNASSSQVLEAIARLDAVTYVDLRMEITSDNDEETEMVIRCVILGEVGHSKPKNPEYLYICSAADEDYNWSNLRRQAGHEDAVVTWTNAEGVSELPRSWLTTREQVSEAARVFVETGRFAEVANCLWT